MIRRSFPEPACGGRSQLERGVTEFVKADARQSFPVEEEFEQSEAQEQVMQQRVAPDTALVLGSDPRT